MFDMGFTEIVLIGVVALVVIGPERLPGVARTAGKYFGRMRRFVNTVKSDVESELRADELREIMSKQQEELNSLKDAVSGAGKDFERSTFGEPSEAATRYGEKVDKEANQDAGDDTGESKNWTESIQKPQDKSSSQSQTDESQSGQSGQPETSEASGNKTEKV